MLRGENIVAGTTTTGTGTLALKAPPVPGCDFDVLARTTGIGLANNSSIAVSYTIIEYTDTSFVTAKTMEKGWGTLTLGSSSGIVNCTFARTTIQVTATNLNTPPATYNTNAPSAMSIVVAANTLVFIGAAANDLIQCDPYFDFTSVGGSGVMFLPGDGSSVSLSGLNGAENWSVLPVNVPILAKKASIRVMTSTTGTTNAYARIYATGSNGRPDKLLIDFGPLGTVGSALNTAPATISSAVHATGFYLTPGFYWQSTVFAFTTGTPAVASGGGHSLSRNGGQSGFSEVYKYGATGGANPAPDPANTTGWTNSGASSVAVAVAYNSS